VTRIKQNIEEEERKLYQSFLKLTGPISIPCFVQTSSRNVVVVVFFGGFDVERIKDTSPTNDAWAYYIYYIVWADAPTERMKLSAGVFWGWHCCSCTCIPLGHRLIAYTVQQKYILYIYIGWPRGPGPRDFPNAKDKKKSYTADSSFVVSRCCPLWSPAVCYMMSSRPPFFLCFSVFLLSSTKGKSMSNSTT
jgi:hypothetical protein